MGASAGAGLPAAAYIGWLVARRYAYDGARLMPDWRDFAAAVAGLVTPRSFNDHRALANRVRLISGLTIGVWCGLVLAFLTAIAFGRGLGRDGRDHRPHAWPAFMAADFAARGIDTEPSRTASFPSERSR